MAAADIAIGITATDQASPVIQRVNAILEAQGRSFQQAGDASQHLERSWQRLTSGTEFLAGGLSRVRFALQSIVFGTVIGAAAALTFELSRQAFAWLAVETASANADRRLKEASVTMADTLKKQITDTTRQLQDLTSPGLMPFWKQLMEIGSGDAWLPIDDRARALAQRLQLLARQYAAVSDTAIKAAEAQARAQEAAGRRIIAMEQYEQRAQAEKGRIQEQLGRQIISQYQYEQQAIAVSGRAQEARGRQIVSDYQYEIRALEEKGRIQEQLGRRIIRLFEYERQALDALNQAYSQGLTGQFAQQVQHLQALNGALGETAQKLASLSEAFDTMTAAGQIAGSFVATFIDAVVQMGVAGEFSGRAFAAAMLRWVSSTLANLAVLATTKVFEMIAWAHFAEGLALIPGFQSAGLAAPLFYAAAWTWGKVAAGAAIGAIATGIAAGKTGGAGGSGSLAGPLPGKAGAAGTTPQTVSVVVNLHSTFIDQASLDQVMPALIDGIGRALNDNSGQLGNIKLVPNTGYRRL